MQQGALFQAAQRIGSRLEYNMSPKKNVACSLLLLLVCFLVLLGACGGGDDSAPSSPPSVGPASTLAEIEQRVRAGQYNNVHSVIVYQDGELEAEWYFAGADERLGSRLGRVEFNSDRLHDVRSVSKSVVSLLVGIAIHEGAILSEDDTLERYLPDYADLLTAERANIRLRDLLSMSSGLKWDEWSYSYGDTRNDEYMMNQSADRVRYTLSREMEATPGQRFRYSGGDVEVAAAVLARATGVPLSTYAQYKLFQPLGITQYEWVELRGTPMAAAGLRLRPMDMAKIGRMMLDRGRFDGVQVVAESWVTNSLSRKVSVGVGSYVGTNSPCTARMIEYGYYWWLHPDCAPPFVEANGNGGQRISIYERSRLVIVTTAGMYGSTESGNVDRLKDDVVTVLGIEN